LDACRVDFQLGNSINIIFLCTASIQYIFEMVEKLFTSSLNICTKRDGNAYPPPSTPHYFPAEPLDISLKDDVTVILLLGVSSMTTSTTCSTMFVHACKAAKRCT
jgi:hypothetical protein